MALQGIPSKRRYTPIEESNSTSDLAEILFKTVSVDARTMTSYGEDVESSTAGLRDSKFLEERAISIFTAAKEEIFEDGMESHFSRSLSGFIVSFGQPAMEAIIDIILSNRVNTEITSETLRILGRLRHKSTYRERLWLLERCLLYSPFARVRDGAILGLSFLNDHFAIAPLKSAIEKETIPELRRDMEKVLNFLEGIENGISAKKDSKKSMV